MMRVFKMKGWITVTEPSCIAFIILKSTIIVAYTCGGVNGGTLQVNFIPCLGSFQKYPA